MKTKKALQVISENMQVAERLSKTIHRSEKLNLLPDKMTASFLVRCLSAAHIAALEIQARAEKVPEPRRGD